MIFLNNNQKKNFQVGNFKKINRLIFSVVRASSSEALGKFWRGLKKLGLLTTELLTTFFWRVLGGK